MAKTVLIVEDDAAALSGLKKMIESRGYEVFAAATFEDGKRLLKSRHPDVLITDVRLGAFNGLQFLLGVPEQTHAIVLTGFPDHVLEAEANKLGAYFILKPIVPERLLELVDTLIDSNSHAMGDGQARTPRRWKRKPITSGLAARINSAPARVLDVSYGGLRLGFGDRPSDPLPHAFDVVLADRTLAVPVELVWQSYTDVGVECGVAISSMNQEAALAWQGIVDAVA